MSTQYCSSCRGEDGARIEMDEIKSKLRYSVFQCPCCMGKRKVDSDGVSASISAEEAHSLTKTSFLGKVAKVAAVGVVIAIAAAAADDENRK